MPILDLSLENPNISAYFNGKSTYVPVAEFLWVHTHHVPTNFVSQIEERILIKAEEIAQGTLPKGKKQAISDRLRVLGEKLGVKLAEVNEKNAPEILEILRQIWVICK